MKIFIDTAPFIYLIEQHPDFSEKVKTYFIDRFKSGDEFVTSIVTISEFGVKPHRDQRLELIVQLKDFIEQTGIDVLPIDLTHAELAAKLRGKYPSLYPNQSGLGLPDPQGASLHSSFNFGKVPNLSRISIKGMDAFQVALAIDAECSKFLTNDKPLAKLDEIEAVLVSEL